MARRPIPQLAFLVLLAAPGGAQVPTELPAIEEALRPAAPWVATYGGANADRIEAAVRAAGHGFFLAGDTFSFGGGSGQIWIAHITDQGLTRWEQALGGAGGASFGALRATPDGGCVLVGSHCGGAGRGTVAWIIKLDEGGAVEWQRTYDAGSGNEAFTALARSPNGYYVGGVVEEAPLTSRHDAVVLEVDGSGNVLWQHRFVGDLNEALKAVTATRDGLLVSIDTPSTFRGSPGVLFSRPWVLRLDGAGNVLWQRSYKYSDGDAWNDIIALETGGFLAVGELVANGFARGDAWLTRLDDAGNVLWDRVVGDISFNFFDAGLEVQATRDGGFVVVGATGTGGAGSDDLWVLKFNDAGVLLWSRTLGGDGFDGGSAVALFPDGDLLVAGFAQGLRDPGPVFIPVDAIAMRLNPRGQRAAGCALPSFATTPGVNFSGVPLIIEVPSVTPTALALATATPPVTVVPLDTRRFRCAPR